MDKSNPNSQNKNKQTTQKSSFNSPYRKPSENERSARESSASRSPNRAASSKDASSRSSASEANRSSASSRSSAPNREAASRSSSASSPQAAFSSLERSLKGLRYPVSKEDLINCAQKNGASPQIMKALRQAPAKQYNDFSRVSQELRAFE